VGIRKTNRRTRRRVRRRSPRRRRRALRAIDPRAPARCRKERRRIRTPRSRPRRRLSVRPATSRRRRPRLSPRERRNRNPRRRRRKPTTKGTSLPSRLPGIRTRLESRHARVHLASFRHRAPEASFARQDHYRTHVRKRGGHGPPLLFPSERFAYLQVLFPGLPLQLFEQQSLLFEQVAPAGLQPPPPPSTSVQL